MLYSLQKLYIFTTAIVFVGNDGMTKVMNLGSYPDMESIATEIERFGMRK